MLQMGNIQSLLSQQYSCLVAEPSFESESSQPLLANDARKSSAVPTPGHLATWRKTVSWVLCDYCLGL